MPLAGLDKPDSRTLVLSILFIVLVILGAGLRLWQYAANPAIWQDEVAVARNILDRPLIDLLVQPLAYDQSAPKGFLLAEKAAVSLFGPSDHALRLPALLASILALIVFWRIVAKRLDGFAGVVALALFATAVPLVAFAAQVKQYSSDVAIATSVLWLALELNENTLTVRRGFWIGIAGGVLVWFSQPAVIVVFGVTASFILLAWFDRGDRRVRKLPVLAASLGVWTVSASLSAVAAWASLTVATREYMHRFWAPGFPPYPRRRVLETLWPWDPLERLIGVGGAPASLGYPSSAFYIGLSALGFVILWRRNRTLAGLLLAPIGLTLVAALAKQYPFSDRLILFLAPGLFIAIGESSEWIRERFHHWSRASSVFVPLVVVGFAVHPLVKTPPPYQLENMKPALKHLQTMRRPGDAIYVFYGAAPEMMFYAAAYGIAMDEFYVGSCNRGDTRRYFEEIDTFRGNPRVWVLLTHAIVQYREREDVLGYLDTIGFRRDYFAVESHVMGRNDSPAEVFLYDLSDPLRLRRTNAASFPVMGPSIVYPQIRCGEGPLAMVPTRGPVQ